MLVVDANIVVRAVLGRRVRKLLDEYAGRGVRFFAPSTAFADAAKYLPQLLKKRGKSTEGLTETLDYLQGLIETVPAELYGRFEKDARRRLRGRDEDDWPVLAAALALTCPVWTEDADFFGTGVPVWTTNRVEIYLSGSKGTAEANDD